MRRKLLLATPLPAALEAVLDEAFDVHRLANESDQAGFVAARGADFGLLVTTSELGADGATLSAMRRVELVVCIGDDAARVDAEGARRRGARVIVARTRGGEADAAQALRAALGSATNVRPIGAG